MKRLRRPTAAAAAVLLAAFLALFLTACLHDDGDESGREAALTTGTTTTTASEAQEASEEEQEAFADLEAIEEDVSEPPGKPPEVVAPRDPSAPAFPDAGPPAAAAAADEGLKPPPAPKRTDEATWQALSKKAKGSSEETVPVIVVLNVDAQPEGKLRKEQKDAQRKGIADKKNAVVSRLKGKKYKNLKTFEVVPFMAVHAGADALAELKKSPDVASVTEEKPILVPELPPGSDQPEPPASVPQGVSSNENLANWWHLNHVGITTANSNGYDGRGWHVAVADTGVQSSHQGLNGKVVNETCFATGNWCPNGTSVQYGAGAARPCTYAPAFCAHGTHVAHIAAGYWGVARAAKVIAIQVFHRETSGCPPGWSVCAKSWPSDQLEALEHIWNIRGYYNIAAVNFSLGGGKYGNYCDNVGANYGFYTMAYWLRSVGIATVVSSGNEKYQDGIGSPSCISNVISVGNTTLNASNQDAVFWESNHDDILSMLAPGTRICSAVPTSGWDCWNGTSMAAPHVAGAMASLKQLRYWASVTSMATALQASGPSVTGPLGVPKRRINVWQAINYLYTH